MSLADEQYRKVAITNGRLFHYLWGELLLNHSQV